MAPDRRRNCGGCPRLASAGRGWRAERAGRGAEANRTNAPRPPRRFAARHPLPVSRGEGKIEPAALFLLLSLLQRSAENIAQRRARVGRAVFRDRFLLLG